MARVYLSGELSALAGIQEIEIAANDIRSLLRALENDFPALKGHLSKGLAIAVDGEIVNAPLLETLSPASEVHFIPAIEAG